MWCGAPSMQHYKELSPIPPISSSSIHVLLVSKRLVNSFRNVWCGIPPMQHYKELTHHDDAHDGNKDKDTGHGESDQSSCRQRTGPTVSWASTASLLFSRLAHMVSTHWSYICQHLLGMTDFADFCKYLLYSPINFTKCQYIWQQSE